MKYPLRHKKCGTVIGYQTTKPKFGDVRSSATFEFLDGTKPERYSEFKVWCHVCKENLAPNQIDRGIT